ncbi:hypothetical protein PFISCL1PPCAC_17124, partial [Pristionchus fissidentatus]
TMQGKCCCGSMSSTTGSKVLALVFIITSLGFLISATSPVEMKGAIEWRTIPRVWAVLSIASSLLVFIATHRTIPNLMLPVIAGTAFAIFSAVILLFISLTALFVHDSWIAKMIK